MHAWESLNGSTYVAGGSYNELVAMVGGGTLYDITPSDLTAGLEKASIITGYGYGNYGADDYGVERQNYGNYSEANTFSLDNWGEYLVACSYGDGRLLEWQLGVTTGSELVTNGNFAVSTGWTLGAGWSVTGGVAKFTANTTVSNLEQTIGSLTSGEKYYLTLSFIDPDVDGNEATIPSAKVKVLGTNTSTTLLDETLSVGGNTFQFEIDDTSIDIQIYAASNTEPELHVDEVSFKLGVTAAVISNAPTNNLGLVTTEERFLFALGAGGNPRKVQWCDQEDNTSWSPLATNQAGDIELQTAGQIMQGIRTRGQTLIITDTDAHAARYIGPPFVFSFERVGTACGAISRQAAVDVDQGVFWMGQRGFFTFAGNTVQEIQCQVHDYVFDDFNREQQSQVWAWSNTEYGEIWWFYPSSSSSEVDRYVAFDYIENHWTIGELSRTAGVSRGVFKRPFMIGTNKTVYEHEVGNDYQSATVFAETGPVSLGDGSQTMNVLQLIPDEKTQGQVSVNFKTRFYPNAAETTHGPYTPANPTDVRFSGRQFRMRVEGAVDADWRVGVMRVDAMPAGKR
jgi:hypothetical protein